VGNNQETCGSDGQWGQGQACAVACCGVACADTTKDPANCGACGMACAAGYACGTTFAAFTGSQPAGWNANGSAIYNTSGNYAQLTDNNTTGEAGTWVYAHALQIDTITVQFDFNNGVQTGADGMGIVFEQDGPTALGSGAQGLGIANLTGFGVEIDDYNNMACLDDNQNHIGIDALALCNGSMPNTLVVNDNPGFETDDGNWHTMIVRVANGAFTVTADGHSEFTSYTPSGWANGAYYLGFGGGTGGLTNFHDVRNVTVTFDTPHCY
jgi:hypothetical protein